MILGIDVGYSHTKVYGKDLEFSFKSTIEKGTIDVFNSIQIEYQGENYTIGENNNNSLYDTTVNKIESLNFKLCLYTAIAKAMTKHVDEDIKIVTGLPASYYSSQKQALINELKDKTVVMVINGQPRKFTIIDVLVFPQSSGVLLLEPNKLVGDTCIVDIGGFTVDVSFFVDKDLKKLDTLELGMNILAKDLINEIKARYGVAYDILRADYILDSKEIVVEHKAINIQELIDTVLQKHADLIINRLKGMKEYNTSKLIFIGGGSLRLANYLNQTVDKDTIFTNAKAFYVLGANKFNG